MPQDVCRTLPAAARAPARCGSIHWATQSAASSRPVSNQAGSDQSLSPSVGPDLHPPLDALRDGERVVRPRHQHAVARVDPIERTAVELEAVRELMRGAVGQQPREPRATIAETQRSVAEVLHTQLRRSTHRSHVQLQPPAPERNAVTLPAWAPRRWVWRARPESAPRSAGDAAECGRIEVVDVDRVPADHALGLGGGNVAEGVPQREPRDRRCLATFCGHERAFEVGIVGSPEQLRGEPVQHRLLHLVRRREARTEVHVVRHVLARRRGTCARSAWFNGSSRLES